MQVKLLYSNSISDLEKRTDNFLSSLQHDIIKLDIVNTVENFEHRYIENVIYDDLDEYPEEDESECPDFIDESDESENADTPFKPLNNIKIIRSNGISDLELKINTYLSEIRQKVGSFPVTDIVQDIIIKQYDTTNCEFKYIAWILHDCVILNACE